MGYNVQLTCPSYKYEVEQRNFHFPFFMKHNPLDALVRAFAIRFCYRDLRDETSNTLGEEIKHFQRHKEKKVSNHRIFVDI